MSALFSSPKIPAAPAPQPTPPAPRETEASVENSASAEKVRLMRAMGRQSTMLSDQAKNSSGKATMG